MVHLTKLARASLRPVWAHFLVGWVNDDDVACITKESISGIQGITLNPTDAPASGAEAVFIKLNNEELIAIEYREMGPYNTWATGLTAYRLSVNDPYVRRDDLPILEAEALNWWSFIRQGESELITDVTEAGIRIRSRGNGEIWLSVE